jgi:hypothetical protein
MPGNQDGTRHSLFARKSLSQDSILMTHNWRLAARPYFLFASFLKGFSAACKFPPVLHAKLEVSRSVAEKHFGHRAVELAWLKGILNSNSFLQ